VGLVIFLVWFSVAMNGCSSPVRKLTNTPQAMPSANPTFTVSATSVPSQMVTHTEIPLHASQTSIPPTQTSSATEAQIIDQWLSPNRRWTAMVTRITRTGTERVVFTVDNDHGRIVWLVEDISFSEDPPTGFSFPKPFYWSQDGHFLFFTHSSSGDGCFGGGLHAGWDLYRLDLATGGVEQISSKGGSWISMSPDESTFAYLFYAKAITIHDISTGREFMLDMPLSQESIGMELDARYILWSPGSRFLVYVIMAGVCDGEEESDYNWLVMVDVHNETHKLVLERDERGLIPISWTVDQGILLRDNQQHMWWLDPESGEMIPEGIN
jgi:hypothetical protein